MLLDGLALLDELVLGRGKAALHGGAAHEPGNGAEHGALEHFCRCCQLTVEVERRFGVVTSKLESGAIGRIG